MKTTTCMSTPPIESSLSQRTRVAEINRLHKEIAGHLRTSLEKGIHVGGLLTEQKAELPHGQWAAWVETNLSFTIRTATNYMRLYTNRNRLESETVSDLTGAYRLLAAPRNDDNEGEVIAGAEDIDGDDQDEVGVEHDDDLMNEADVVEANDDDQDEDGDRPALDLYRVRPVKRSDTDCFYDDLSKTCDNMKTATRKLNRLRSAPPGRIRRALERQIFVEHVQDLLHAATRILADMSEYPAKGDTDILPIMMQLMEAEVLWLDEHFPADAKLMERAISLRDSLNQMTENHAAEVETVVAL